MRRIFTALLLVSLLAMLAGCTHTHEPSEASKFSDDTHVQKN